MRSYFAASAFFLFIFIPGCREHTGHEPRTIGRSFYFWKSVFKITEAEKKLLADLRVTTIYLKAFDITWSPQSNSPLPTAQIRISDSAFLQRSGVNLIPVIFLTNETIYRLDSGRLRELADHSMTLVKNIFHNSGLQEPREMQIDCDWTAGTKAKYFSLLQQFTAADPDIVFSATIRLHQVKYREKTGIPPVRKGMLMCYNMGNLQDPAVNNSIIDPSELEKYTGDLAGYPISLDIALPIFEWQVIFRQGKFAGISNLFNENVLRSTCFSASKNFYTLLKDSVFNDIPFYRGDVIRAENSSYEDVIASARRVSEKLKDHNLRVSLYHLDTVILKKYSAHEMEDMYDALR